MIKIYPLSNLNLIYDNATRHFIALEREVIINENEKEEKHLREEIPVFSADALTHQESYLIMKFLDSKNSFERLFKTYVAEKEEASNKIEERENSCEELMEIVRLQNEEILKYKSEIAGLKMEIKELRRFKDEGECP